MVKLLHRTFLHRSGETHLFRTDVRGTFSPISPDWNILNESELVYILYQVLVSWSLLFDLQVLCLHRVICLIIPLVSCYG